MKPGNKGGCAESASEACHGQVPMAPQQERSCYCRLVLGALSAKGQAVLLGMLLRTWKNTQTSTVASALTPVYTSLKLRAVKKSMV